MHFGVFFVLFNVLVVFGNQNVNSTLKKCFHTFKNAKTTHYLIIINPSIFKV